MCLPADSFMRDCLGPNYYVRSFYSYDSFRTWSLENRWLFDRSYIQEIVDHCRQVGIQSAWLGYVAPASIEIKGLNYRESLCGRGLNSRLRAVLDVLTMVQGIEEVDAVKIYATENITLLAKTFRQRFPGFVGSEYAPTADALARVNKLFATEHQDLGKLTYATGTFDIAVSTEVLEHVPNLPAAFRELARVLKSSGVLIATFPFLFKKEESRIQARLLATGEIEHLTTPEYHGNPADPSGGSLVFQTPGWDILKMSTDAGFSKSAMLLISSRSAGIVSSELAGVLIFVGQK